MYFVHVSPLRFQLYRQDHVEEVFFTLHGHDDSRGYSGIQFNFDGIGRRVTQRLHQISVVKSDLQTAAVSGNPAYVLCFAASGLCGEHHPVMIEQAAHGLFSFSKITTETRSMLSISLFRLTVTAMGFCRGTTFL